MLFRSISATGLLAGDPNRCTLLHQLKISRDRLRKCITGYGFPVKEGKVKMRVLNSKIALDLVYLGDLVILPDFPHPASTTALNCYPYNSPILTSSQKMDCLKNKDSKECLEYIKDLLENYYCCEETYE